MDNSTTSKASAWNAKDESKQYSLAKILGIWAAVAIPSFILAWVVFPAITPDFESDPIGAGYARMGSLTIALFWVFLLAMIIVYREEGDLRWSTLKRRLRLQTPLDPKTGEPRRKLWWWVDRRNRVVLCPPRAGRETGLPVH